MKNTVVAVPSNHPGGLESALGAHFGHCDLYTLVEVVDGEVQKVRTLPDVPHQQGGCMAPVNHLAQHGVQILIAGSMGMRPLMGFQSGGNRCPLRCRRSNRGRCGEGFLERKSAAVYH
jgi:predicted Fe-Mo cluster-binding NifX family protein